MKAENSNMIFHSFSWAFWLGRETLSHKLWQKPHPTRHRSDLLSEGPITPAERLLEGKGGTGHRETVTGAGKWRPNGWSVRKKSSRSECEPRSSKGNSLGWPVYDKSQHELLYWFQCCTVTPILLLPPPAGGGAIRQPRGSDPAKMWMYLDSSSAPLTWTQTCSNRREVVISKWVLEDPFPEKTWSSLQDLVWHSPACLLSRCIGCIYCWLFYHATFLLLEGDLDSWNPSGRGKLLMSKWGVRNKAPECPWRHPSVQDSGFHTAIQWLT